MDQLIFRPTEEKDLPAALDIYNYYVENTTATFHIGRVGLDTMRGILRPGDTRHPSFLIEENGAPRGYVLLIRFHEREAFRKTAEVTVYLAPGAGGRGLGGAALDFIEGVAGKKGFHSLIATICHENGASVRLFSSRGYFEAARLREVGFKFGRPLDLLIYEKLLILKSN